MTLPDLLRETEGARKKWVREYGKTASANTSTLLRQAGVPQSTGYGYTFPPQKSMPCKCRRGVLNLVNMVKGYYCNFCGNTYSLPLLSQGFPPQKWAKTSSLSQWGVTTTATNPYYSGDSERSSTIGVDTTTPSLIYWGYTTSTGPVEAQEDTTNV